MDDIYGRIPHMRSLGPDEDEAEAIHTCGSCWGDIRVGDYYIDIGEGVVVCRDCIESMSAKEFIEVFEIEYSQALPRERDYD